MNGLDTITHLDDFEKMISDASEVEAQAISQRIRQIAWAPKVRSRARKLAAQADQIAGSLPRLPRWPGATNGTAGPVW